MVRVGIFDSSGEFFDIIQNSRVPIRRIEPTCRMPSEATQDHPWSPYQSRLQSIHVATLNPGLFGHSAVRVHFRRSIRSLNLETKVDRGFVTNTQFVSKPVGVFRSRCANCVWIENFLVFLAAWREKSISNNGMHADARTSHRWYWTSGTRAQATCRIMRRTPPENIQRKLRQAVGYGGPVDGCTGDFRSVVRWIAAALGRWQEATGKHLLIPIKFAANTIKRWFAGAWHKLTRWWHLQG